MSNGFITLLGGGALLVFSIESLSQTIQYLAGNKFRTWINIFARNRISAVALGFVLSILMGSSGAVTVLLVGLANSRILRLDQVLSMTLGAIIGTTMIVQVMAFRVSEYALLIISFGVIGTYLAKDDTPKHAARGLLFLGLMFMSMGMVQEAGFHLQDNAHFGEVMGYLKTNPFATLVISTALTAMVFSSAATLAFIMSIFAAQHGNIYDALPWVLGANLGTTSTAFLAVRGGVAGKQAALGHLLIKVVAIILIFPVMHYWGELSALSSSDIARQIANSHTLFNLAVAVFFFPFITWGVKVVEYFIRENPRDTDYIFFYLDKRSLNAPELALAQAHREILRLSDYVERMVEQSIHPFLTLNLNEVEKILETDKIVDYLHKGIKLHLTKLSQKEMTPDQVHKEFDLLFRTNDLESIGDIVDKGIMGLVRKTIKKGYQFSPEGWEEIKQFHAKILECLKLSTAYFASSDTALGVKLTLLAEEIEENMRDLNEKHIQRLHQGIKASLESSSVHLDLMGQLHRIAVLSVNFTHLTELKTEH